MVTRRRARCRWGCTGGSQADGGNKTGTGRADGHYADVLGARAVQQCSDHPLKTFKFPPHDGAPSPLSPCVRSRGPPKSAAKPQANTLLRAHRSYDVAPTDPCVPLTQQPSSHTRLSLSHSLSLTSQHLLLTTTAPPPSSPPTAAQSAPTLRRPPSTRSPDCRRPPPRGCRPSPTTRPTRSPPGAR